MTNVVKVQHLSKSIEGSPILNDICISVKQKEICEFLDANGAGLMSISIAGIIKTIGVISLITGICFIGVGLFFLFLDKKKGKKRELQFYGFL